MEKTPKEYAEELVEEFYSKDFIKHEVDGGGGITDAKECAKIAVERILKAVTTIADKKYDYYQQVKTEIENL